MGERPVRDADGFAEIGAYGVLGDGRGVALLAAGPLGLMSEMCAPGTNEQLGNLPQALSHLSHIQATSAIRAAHTTKKRG